jgi:hypothetical protein
VLILPAAPVDLRMADLTLRDMELVNQLNPTAATPAAMRPRRRFPV